MIATMQKAWGRSTTGACGAGPKHRHAESCSRHQGRATALWCRPDPVSAHRRESCPNLVEATPKLVEVSNKSAPKVGPTQSRIGSTRKPCVVNIAQCLILVRPELVETGPARMGAALNLAQPKPSVVDPPNPRELAAQQPWKRIDEPPHNNRNLYEMMSWGGQHFQKHKVAQKTSDEIHVLGRATHP